MEAAHANICQTKSGREVVDREGGVVDHLCCFTAWEDHVTPRCWTHSCFNECEQVIMYPATSGSSEDGFSSLEASVLMKNGRNQLV